MLVLLEEEEVPWGSVVVEVAELPHSLDDQNGGMALTQVQLLSYRTYRAEVQREAKLEE